MELHPDWQRSSPVDAQMSRDMPPLHVRDNVAQLHLGCDTVIACLVLNEALAVKIVGVLRYKRHFFMATAIGAAAAANAFAEYAADDQNSLDRIAHRIVQLGGRPNFSPEGLLERSHSDYTEACTLPEMIREDLEAEWMASNSCLDIAAYFAPFDAVTQMMMQEIQAVSEQHADCLARMQRRGLPASAGRSS